MRILQVNSARAFAGGERHVADLANALARRGHEVYAAVAPNSPLIKRLSDLPHENIFIVRMRNALDLPSALQLAAIIRDQNIDIIHAHVARDYPLAAIAVGRARSNTRFVITRHLLRSLSRVHRWALSRVSRVIAPGQAKARALCAQKIFPAEKISVVIHGIDLEKFDKTRDNNYRQSLPSRAQFLVGIAGELREHKGQEDFVRAAALVAPRCPNVDFLIAGDDTATGGEYLTRLKHLIADLQLQDRVHLLGWIDDVGKFYAALDLFVSASRIEPFGLVMVEAMASGTPIVATATEGAREIIEDGITGRLVPVGDVNSLAVAIRELIVNEPRRERMGNQAQTIARRRFSLERMVQQTEAIYREVLSSGMTKAQASNS